jgi:ABC-2 type transport system permease protein
MRKIWAIVQRDLISITRDAMFIFVVLSPILISLGVRFLLPSVGQASINLALTEVDAPALAAELERYANVEVVADSLALERRVLAFDDTVGVLPDGRGGYTLVLEGNESLESQALPAIVLQHIAAGTPHTIELREVGQVRVPYRGWMGAFMAVTVLFFASFVMALHIIEDKESRMMLALGASPLPRRIYVLARGLFASLLSMLLVSSSLIALGMPGINYAQVLVATLIGSLTAILFAFVVGAISANQIAGIAAIKFGFFVIIAPGALTLLLPERLWWALSWAPTYWGFRSYKGILIEGLSWAELWPLLLWNLVSSLALMAIAYPWLRRRLDFARD